MDYEDEYELYTDTFAKNHQTPHQVMTHLFNDVHNRNMKSYLASIEWDGEWLRHDTEEEAEQRRLDILENKRIAELKYHPFKKWF